MKKNNREDTVNIKQSLINRSLDNDKIKCMNFIKSSAIYYETFNTKTTRKRDLTNKSDL